VAELAESATRPPDLELEVVELTGSTLSGWRELVEGREERAPAGDDAELRWRRSAASPADADGGAPPPRSRLPDPDCPTPDLSCSSPGHARSTAKADLRHRETHRRSRPPPHSPAAASIQREREGCEREAR
jgi:hypothetical protein